MRIGPRVFLALAVVALASCQRGDWQAEAIAAAEDEMRADVKDPSAQFSRVQVTGDDATGQTCGSITAKAGGRQKRGRFIVYIDGTAGPFVQSGLGSQFMSPEDFAWAWQNDCLNEGYKS